MGDRAKTARPRCSGEHRGRCLFHRQASPWRERAVNSYVELNAGLFLLPLRRLLLRGLLSGLLGFLFCHWHELRLLKFVRGRATQRPPKREQYEGVAFSIASMTGIGKMA